MSDTLLPVSLTMTKSQLGCVATSLHTYVRLTLGQAERLGEMVRQGEIGSPVLADPSQEADAVAQINDLCRSLKLTPVRHDWSVESLADSDSTKSTRAAYKMWKEIVDFIRIHAPTLQVSGSKFPEAREADRIIQPRIKVESSNKNDDSIRISLDKDQAGLLSRCLDLYARLGIGQIEEMAELVRWNEIGGLPQDNDKLNETTELVDDICRAIKSTLGHPAHGSFSIANPHTPEAARRAWELKKQIAQALALDKDPEPDFKNVAYDGRMLRLTDDPDIEITIDSKPTDTVETGPAI